MKKVLLLSFLAILCFFAQAQKIDPASAIKMVSTHAAAIGISNDEINNAFVSDAYHSNTSGINLVYLQQGYKGIPVYNSLRVLAFKNDRLVSSTGGFITGIDNMASPQSGIASINASRAVQASFSEAKLPAPAAAFPLSSENNRKQNFGMLPGTIEDVKAELMWVPVQNGQAVKLSWQVQVVPSKTSDWWMIQVDAVTGNVIGKTNLTVYETHGHKNEQQQTATSFSQNYFFNTNGLQNTDRAALVNTVNYLVCAYPAESPIHPGGAPAVRTNPWTSTPGNASSLGWHNDGNVDYTISRGNNVWATEDRAGTNTNTGISTPTGLPASSSTSPDPLNFQFTPSFTSNPTTATNQQFSITNLFYWNNLMHDLHYQYGFNEVAGNFQASNQGRGGAQGDYVIAVTQSSTGYNNANFATPADGGRPRMRMYLFDTVSTLRVNTPLGSAGIYTSVEGAFSTNNRLIAVGPVTAQVVYFDDAGGTHEACTGAPVNSLTGKIALINRGNCNFTVKVLAAQAAGAVGVIMVNNVATPPYLTMAGADNTITIPAVLVSQSDGAILAAQLANNLNVTLSAAEMDGALDAGIVCHEYGHGISNRLTGGPAQAGCLSHAEQGGEGWSDYLGLMMTTNWSTATLTDGALPRPIGTYVVGQKTNESGIRNYPYSTNLITNPLTYANMGTGTIGTEVHNIGEIWCVALWDMTWNIIQQTGNINPNFFNAAGTGGNSIAYKLVMEGMKLQPCSPGFLDARNAILKADSIMYNGTYRCAIWSAFAKRGMGYSAVQGSASSATDHTAASDMPPAPAISTGPASSSACAGENVTFTVATTGSVFSYTWQLSTNGGSTWTDITPVVNSPSLTLTAVTAGMNNYQYRVIVAGGCPFAQATSSPATLTINSSSASITSQPAAVTACTGSNANFTVAASGTGLTYNWQVSTDGGTTWNNVSPAVTTATLTLTSVTAAMNNYQYRCVVSTSGCSGGSGTNSNAATLTVSTNSINITAQPAASTVCAGSNTSFSATATGSGLSYNWQVSTDGGTTWNNVSPAVTTSTLTLTAVTTTMNNYQYRAVITSSGTCAGSLNSSAATLTVTGPAAVTAQPADATICTGSNASFGVTASGSGLSYQWQVSTTGCAGTFTNISGATSATYNITNAASSLNGYAYRAVVTGACAPSATSSCAVLTVNTAPQFTSQPASAVLCAGSNASFSVTASGSNISYNWQVSTDGGSTWNNLSPAVTTATLSLSGVTAAMNNNQYRVQMTGSGTCTTPVVSNAVSLTVNSAAAIGTQPSNAAGCQGSNVSFTAAATGTGITYQWQLSTTGCAGTFTNITGATSASYNVSGLTAAMNNYAYRVVVSGTCAPAATSSCASLTVTAPASITTQPAATGVCAGTDANFTVAASGTGISYQWQVSTDGGTNYTNIAGATGTSYVVTAAAANQNNNRYRVQVTNCGNVTVNSDAAILTVNALPSVTLTQVPASGTPVSLEATVSPAGTYSYQWYDDNELMPGQTASSLALNTSLSGNFQVRATNTVTGCSSSSNGINVVQGRSDVLVIYTNPSDGRFEIMYNNADFTAEKRIINVYDAKGAKVFSKVYDITIPYQRMQVILTNAASGIYMLELMTSDGKKIAADKILIR
ncbi:MAG: M36 family metallopeptidase [Ferruginibacter sp.]